MEKTYNFSLYEQGLLYGDGSLNKDGYYTFSITHDELSELIKDALDRNSLTYYYKKVSYEHLEELKNYNELHHYTIKVNGIEFIEMLSDNFNNLTPQFLLGYVETKGSLFSYTETKKNVANTRHKLSISGSYEELLIIKNYFQQLGCESKSEIHQRNDREEQGIISKSFRYSVNKRDDLEIIMNHLTIDEGSLHIKWRIEGFHNFNRTTPRRIVNHAFKSKRSACMYMIRELNYESEVSRIRGESRLRKVTVKDGDNVIAVTQGWINMYDILHKEFSNKFTVGIPVVAELVMQY